MKPTTNAALMPQRPILTASACSCNCSGVNSSAPTLIISAICPLDEFSPTPIDRIDPRPDVTLLPAKITRLTILFNIIALAGNVTLIDQKRRTLDH